MSHDEFIAQILAQVSAMEARNRAEINRRHVVRDVYPWERRLTAKAQVLYDFRNIIQTCQRTIADPVYALSQIKFWMHNRQSGACPLIDACWRELRSWLAEAERHLEQPAEVAT